MNAFGRYILIGLGILAIGFILWYFSSIVAYVIVAAVLSVVGSPVDRDS